MGYTLITGAAKRLGADIAGHLAAKGHKVVIHYNTSGPSAKELAKSLGGEAIQGDFSTPEGTETFIRDYKARFSSTRFIIHNVGNYKVEGALQTSVSELANLMQTNLFAPIAITEALMPSIIQEKGKVVAIGVTGLSTQKADNYATAYKSTKMALLTYVRALAIELAPHLVTVNMVSPGQLDNSVDMPPDWSKFPMKRPGQMHEVSRVVAFLLEEESGYITGQNIEVSGALNL
jgi:NAD(P)-dependent dehydrogenase (short-subunit alcohol dehydrogenase family)